MKKQWIWVLVTALLLTAFSGCFWDTQDPQKDDPASEPQADTAVTLDIPNELMNISAAHGLLLVESCVPGMDATDQVMTVYAEDTQNVLGQIELADDYWATGIWKQGVYAVSLKRFLITLYQRDGTVLSSVTAAEKDDIPWEFALLNDDATELLYGKMGVLYLYDIQTGARTKVGQHSGYIRALEYRDGNYYLQCETSELRVISSAEKTAYTAYDDPTVHIITPFYGIGHTDEEFYLIFENEPVRCVKFHSVDEAVLAVSRDRFVTVVSEGETDGLWIYDLKDGSAKKIPMTGTVCAALFAEDGELMAVACSGEQCLLHRFDLDEFEETAVTIQTLTTSSVSKTTTAPKTTAPITTTPTKKPTTTAPIKTTMPADPHKKLIDIPVICQMPQYPTGCESVTAVMALRYAGEKISVAQFVDEFLPKSGDFYMSDGVKYGPDPEKVFVGTPRSKSSFGCMQPVIVAAMTSYFGTADRLVDTTGQSLDSLCREYIDRDIPVIVWATIQMRASQSGPQWTLEDGTPYTWRSHEHCLLLVGYDDRNYYFNDPYDGAVVAYEKKLCETRYRELSQQSLVVLPE